jgi:hypothetical protein
MSLTVLLTVLLSVLLTCKLHFVQLGTDCGVNMWSEMAAAPLQQLDAARWCR